VHRTTQGSGGFIIAEFQGVDTSFSVVSPYSRVQGLMERVPQLRHTEMSGKE
jgi:hypothetical protein